MDKLTEDRMRLLDIADSIQEIQGYVGQGNFEDFNTRYDMKRAISEQLIQIGGAASLLTDEFKTKYGDIDWDVLKGLQYTNYDMELEMDLHPIWYIVNNDLPEIAEQILDIATQIEGEEDLSDVALNNEDLQDLKELNADRVARNSSTDFEEDKDIHLEDETFHESPSMGDITDSVYYEEKFDDEEENEGNVEINKNE